MFTLLSWLFDFEDVMLLLFFGAIILLVVGAIAWGIKEHFRIKRSLTGMIIFPSVTAVHTPHDDTIDYVTSFVEHIAPKIAARNGRFSSSVEQSTHILNVGLHARRGTIYNRYAFIIDARIDLIDRSTHTTLAHGNISVDDRPEIRRSPPRRNRDGRIVSRGRLYIADDEQWGITGEGRIYGLGMLADKTLEFLDNNRAVRLLVEKAKKAEATMARLEAEQARRANQPS